MPFLQKQKTVTGAYDNTLTNNRNLRRVVVNQTKLLKSSHVNVNMTFFACLIDYRLLMGVVMGISHFFDAGGAIMKNELSQTLGDIHHEQYYYNWLGPREKCFSSLRTQSVWQNSL